MSNAPLVSHLNGFCFLGTNSDNGNAVSPLLAQSREAQVALIDSVGRLGRNRIDDVRKVQNALNRILGTDGGTQEAPLNPDGICGHHTIEAILRFQEVQFGKGGHIADGTIEKNAPTVNRLNELFLENTVDPARLPSLNNFIERAQRAVGAALANITLALPFLNLSNRSSLGTFNRVDRLRLLNRHFALDSQTNPGLALDQIRQIYNLMRAAFLVKTDFNFGGTTGVGGSGIFVLDPTPRNARGGGSTAYTFAGGFHQPNVFSREFDGLRHDSIYICAGYDSAFDERKVRVILHELAHFVGSPHAGDEVDDHGYGLADDPKMKALSPRKKVHNADTYANFALEAATGRDLTRWV